VRNTRAPRRADSAGVTEHDLDTRPLFSDFLGAVGTPIYHHNNPHLRSGRIGSLQEVDSLGQCRETARQPFLLVARRNHDTDC